MKFKKFCLLILIAVCLFSFAACGNLDTIWSGTKSPKFTIVKGDGIFNNSSKKLTFDVGLDRKALKNNGYTSYKLQLSFDSYIDNGIATSVEIEIVAFDSSKEEIGAIWSGIEFKNVKSNTYEATGRVVAFDKFSKSNSTIILSFTAKSNTLMTGIHISNVCLNVIAE